MDQIAKLKYRKKSSEHQMNRLSAGAKRNMNLVMEIERKLENDQMDDYTRLKLTEELEETKFKAQRFITAFKSTEKDYLHYIRPSLERLAEDDEKKNIQFEDVKEKWVNELMEYELYGATSKIPDNVELPKINEEYQKNIDLQKKLISELAEKIPTLSGYEKAKAEKEMFDYQLSVMNTEKMLAKRKDYYVNTFLPMYEADMKLCGKYLRVYLDRAKKLAKEGVDFQLQFLIDEYKKHKEDDEKMWLFWTTLRSRVDDVMSQMRKNKSKYKNKMHLASAIIKA